MKIIEVFDLSKMDEKIVEIEAKIAAYRAAQAHQIQHGGPGPVADIEIMEIVNEHNGEFQVVLKESVL